jgi:hypothetical protein
MTWSEAIVGLRKPHFSAFLSSVTLAHEGRPIRILTGYVWRFFKIWKRRRSNPLAFAHFRRGMTVHLEESGRRGFHPGSGILTYSSFIGGPTS